MSYLSAILWRQVMKNVPHCCPGILNLAYKCEWGNPVFGRMLT
jgi:hypothetical protein